ncbi:MAG: hypothetical protein ACQER7_01155 [Bacteroidota bacterium]
MRPVKNIIILLTLMVLFFSCNQQTEDQRDKDHPRGTLLPTEPKNVGMSAQRLARIDSLMNRYIENEWLPGSVAFIARKGDITYHTYFYLEKNMADRLVPVYADDEEEGYHPSEVEAYDYPLKGGQSYYSGGAGLLSTANDYGKFIQMLVNKGTYNGHRLLSRKTIEIMTKDHVGDLREESALLEQSQISL